MQNVQTMFWMELIWPIEDKGSRKGYEQLFVYIFDAYFSIKQNKETPFDFINNTKSVKIIKTF